MAIYSKKSKSKQTFDKNMKLKVGISLIVIFSILFINLVFNVLSLFNSFFLGTFGLMSYAIFICGIGVGIMLVLNKSFSLSKIDILLFALWLFFFVAIIHCATTTKLPVTSYGKYLSGTYQYKLSAGGILFSIFTYPVIWFSHSFVSSIVLYAIALVVSSTIIIVRFYDYYQLKDLKPISELDTIENQTTNDSVESSNTTKFQPQFDDSIFVEDEEIEQLEKENKITELTTSEKDKLKAKTILGLNKAEPETNEKPQNSNDRVDDIFNVTNKHQSNNDRPPKYVHEEKSTISTPKPNSSKPKKQLSERDKANLEYLRIITGRPLEDETANAENTVVEEKRTAIHSEPETNNNYRNNINTSQKERTPLIFEENVDTKPITEQVTTEVFDNTFDDIDITDNNEDDIYDENLTYNSVKSNNYSNSSTNNSMFRKPPIIKEDIHEEINLNPIQTQPTTRKMEQMVMGEVATEKDSNKPKYRKPYHYNRPPIDLLNIVHNQASDDDENLIKGKALEEKLASLRIPAKIVSIRKGPAFSQFEMQMPTGISVNKMQNLNNDIAMAVQSNGAIRLETPIPGKNTFGIEVPNEKIDMVGIRDIIESNNFNMSKSPLTFGLGKDITGDAKVARLDKLVHLLVAGATGSGKSVCLNTMLISFLYNASPEDLKIILVDPKQVEFTLYNGLPHMLIPNVITDADQAVMMLDWVCNEMERRYKLLSNLRVRNISEYNEKSEVKDGICEKLPYIVVILDEVGDLMITHKKDIEEKIVRLGQKSRAAGIHMVIATQRPSVDIITGTIKANLPSRIAFAVTSFENSKTIIGCSGAENLLGKGDMLLSDQASPELKRIQGAFVSNEEIENVVNYVKENNECIFDSDIEEAMFSPKNNSFRADSPSDEAYDPLLKDAVRIVLRTNKASVSNIQRKMGVGYPKAGKLVDQMERAGFISEPDEKNNRIIFITPQEFEEKFGEDY